MGSGGKRWEVEEEKGGVVLAVDRLSATVRRNSIHGKCPPYGSCSWGFKMDGHCTAHATKGATKWFLPTPTTTGWVGWVGGQHRQAVRHAVRHS